MIFESSSLSCLIGNGKIGSFIINSICNLQASTNIFSSDAITTYSQLTISYQLLTLLKQVSTLNLIIRIDLQGSRKKGI